MSNKKELVAMGIDVYKNRFASKTYDKNDAVEAMRQALIDLNGGTTIDFKSLRRNKVEIFEILEEILENTVISGLPDDNFFKRFVEYKNLALGDMNSFYIPDNTMLTISEIADGTQILRRQRLDVGQNIPVPTTWKGVKIYEHLTRLLSGRVDFIEMIDAVGEALRVKINDEVYDAFISSFSSLPTGFTNSGDFDEDDLLDIVGHVEAASGKTAIIAGTKKALRKISMAIVADSAKEDAYKSGHDGQVYGTDLVAIKQVHKLNTYDFKLSDSDLYVVAGDVKPVKFVTEGEARIIDGDALANADLTQDYFSATKYGVAVAITDLYGRYNIG